MGKRTQTLNRGALPRRPASSLLTLRASMRCSVKEVVHSVVRDFWHGIALISQNKNRWMSFRRKHFVSGHFEPVMELTNGDAPDTQRV